jgi:hypothetical protein
VTNQTRQFIYGNGRERDFTLRHYLGRGVGVRVEKQGSEEVTVDVSHPSDSEVKITFDVPPPAGEPFMVYLFTD